MIYHYLDETFRQSGGYWHCSIGGLLVPPSQIVDFEIEFSEAIEKCNSEIESSSCNIEFKYSNFFRENSDTYKLAVISEFANIVRSRGLNISISHAKIAEENVRVFGGFFSSPQIAIQYLSATNIKYHLMDITKNQQLQIVVDLGLSESFRPIYDIHSGSTRSIPYMKAMGLNESEITFPNYRNFLAPLYMDSRDSRAIQFSDLVIGLSLARQTGELTGFKADLYQALEPIHSHITINSIEWNKDRA
ncbi:hypothetical protein A7E78_03780 [Syntrophotalea acetylenivorans]|uniref:DUF3800 domain-containing protein n=1 Tax=Syntrophotalea acetylenivorans TaxID=1842532 RepID=A0A1L3GMY7_9BACT|nr:hypothetical protein [Syntrophotalea acetylenivorans]APG27028.1 hypothetical protein A7E78_03780 [Syntrophotalea acetylenivorans]